MESTAVVPRATVQTIVAKRNQALELFAKAHAALCFADDVIMQAHKAINSVGGGTNRYNHHIDLEKAMFLCKLKVPESDAYLKTARWLTDTAVWAHVIQITELEQLMDKTAKDQLNQSLLSDPPEATEDNIFATLQTMMGDADMIFKRGIATCFAKLDRRFRSHDGWKIGSRVILDYAFDEYGSWAYRANHRDTILDIERTFNVLDGCGAACGMLNNAIDGARRGGWGRRQSEVNTEFFKVRIFKNGNAHLWFKRADLVERVNKLLGEYYGAPLTDHETPEDDGGLYNPKTTIAKRYGFFPTPEGVAERVIEDAKLWRGDKGEAPLRVLEPSAGTGNLALLAVAKGCSVDCVEMQPHLADQLRASQIYERVMTADFLAVQPDPARLYDRIIMNPPFDRERDIDHVMHALEFLKPDGFLLAIMSAGTEFRETRKSIAFRDLMTKMKGHFRDLPEGSFSSVGTNVNTLTLQVFKDGRHFYR